MLGPYGARKRAHCGSSRSTGVEWHRVFQARRSTYRRTSCSRCTAVLRRGGRLGDHLQVRKHPRDFQSPDGGRGLTCRPFRTDGDARGKRLLRNGTRNSTAMSRRVETGLDAMTRKSGGFIGAEVIARTQDGGGASPGLSRSHSTTDAAVPLGHEPLLMAGDVVGQTSTLRLWLPRWPADCPRAC